MIIDHWTILVVQVKQLSTLYVSVCLFNNSELNYLKPIYVSCWFNL